MCKERIEAKLKFVAKKYNDGVECLENTLDWVTYSAYKRYNSFINPKYGVKFGSSVVANFVLKDKRKDITTGLADAMARNGYENGLVQIEKHGMLGVFEALLDEYMKRMSMDFKEV